MDNLINTAIEEFKKLDNSPIRIITHLDADGLTSAAILAKTLQKENKPYVISTVKQLNETNLKEFSKEKYKTIFFTDLGSGYITHLNEYLSDKKIFILDHHIPDSKESYENIIHINPHLSEEEKYKELSGSGVVYFFSKKINQENKEFAYLALIGTIGDMHSLEGINKELLEETKQENQIEEQKTLKIFGTQTKPIYNLLRYSTDIYIPGVTGNEQGISEFLAELGIPEKINENRTRLIDLTEEQKKALIAGIILKRMGSEKDPEDIFENSYLLKKEEEGTSTKDIKEFSTLLNACGRLGKASIGISTCMGSDIAKDKANQTMKEYKRELIDAMNWFYNNKKDSEKIIQGNKTIIINAGEEIRETIIGTLASMIANSNTYPPSTLIVSMASAPDNHLKISGRIVSREEDFNLKEFFDKIVEKLGEGISGGHDGAAGALIPVEKEKEFIDTLLEMRG